MPFRPSVSGEMQAAPGTGGIIVGRGEEKGKRVSVAYPALVSRYRAIANSQTPPLSDQRMASILMQYLRSGTMLPPFHQGSNALFLAEFGRLVSVEVARSPGFSLELPMILSLLQTGHLTFETAFSRESPVNPMTMKGAASATTALAAEAQETGRRPGGKAGERIAEVIKRRSALLVTYALREIQNNKLKFGSAADVKKWARDFLIDTIRQRGEQLFGLSDQREAVPADETKLRN
jgi:hypothetical protein